MDDAAISPAVRDLRLALNASSELPREAVCRLARDIDRWLPAHGDLQPLARRLGVPAAALERALELRAKAPRIARRECDSAARLEARLPQATNDELGRGIQPRTESAATA